VAAGAWLAAAIGAVVRGMERRRPSLALDRPATALCRHLFVYILARLRRHALAILAPGARGWDRRGERRRFTIFPAAWLIAWGGRSSPAAHRDLRRVPTAVAAPYWTRVICRR
jgi:hypothetical protein